MVIRIIAFWDAWIILTIQDNVAGVRFAVVCVNSWQHGSDLGDGELIVATCVLDMTARIIPRT